MSYRDDLDAAIMRAEAATRDHARLVEANHELERQLADAREWLGGPRRRILVVWGVGALCLAVGAAVALVVRSAVEPPVRVAPPARVEPAAPQVFGTIAADGPQLGRWALNATRCVSRTDGIELTAVGSEDHAIWLSNGVVEVEIPSGDFILDAAKCHRRLVHEVHRDVRWSDGQSPTLSGYVALDCLFDGNSLQGRIDFKDCR